MLQRIIIFLCYCYLIHGLRWTKSGVANNFKTLHLNTSNHNINLDVSYETQIIIVRDVQFWNYSMIIDCFIKGNTDQTYIYSFCKNDETCIKIKEKTDSLAFIEFSIEGVIRTFFRDRRGFRIEIRIPNKYIDVSGNYFCKVNNDKMVLRSNYVELRDTFFWERKIFTKIESSYKSNIQNITIESLPSIFNCSDGNSELNELMPTWAKLQFPNRVSWSVCPVLKDYNKLKPEERMSTEKCLTYTGSKCGNKINEEICPIGLSKMEGWKYIINDRGDLIFIDLPQQNSNTWITYVLMCYTKDIEGELQSISYFLNKKNDIDFISGIAIDGTPSLVSKQLNPISPLIQNITIFARQISSDIILQPLSIYVLYKSSSASSYQWLINDVKLNSNSLITVSKYMITFNNEISSDQSGKYSLEVSDQINKLNMEINVRVSGPPILENDQCMQPVLYIFEGRNLNFSCKYKNNPTVMKLLINSQEIQFNDSITTSQTQLKTMYPHLRELSFAVNVTIIEPTIVIITYNAYNLRKTEGNTQYQDHTVTFYVSNEYGMSLKTTTIYIIPMLKTIMNVFPDQDNCTLSCSSSNSHIFRCDANVEEYNNKELIIKQYWTFAGLVLKTTNDTSDSMYSSFFQINPKNNKLTLPSINSMNPRDKIMKEALTNNYLECRITLVSSSQERLDFSYDSLTDITLNKRMIAKITLDYNPLSTASSYWVIGVVLACIVILICIALIIFYTNGRKKKKSIIRSNVKERNEGVSTTEELLNA